MKKLKLWRMLSCRRRAEGSITLAEAVEIAARYNLSAATSTLGQRFSTVA